MAMISLRKRFGTLLYGACTENTALKNRPIIALISYSPKASHLFKPGAIMDYQKKKFGGQVDKTPRLKFKREDFFI